MKRILIADAGKASLVMTSEVFKDHFPGVQVVVARSSSDALEAAKNCPDMDAIVVDFDLPDRDGAQTAAKLKKLYHTPILITAFERPEVVACIEKELSGYDDCLNFLRKPVKAEVVVAVARRFCEGRFRTQRRLMCQIPSIVEIMPQTPQALTPQATRRGRKTQEENAQRVVMAFDITDCSLGGIKLKLSHRNAENSKVFPRLMESLLQSQVGDSVVVQMPTVEEIEGALWSQNGDGWYDTHTLEGLGALMGWSKKRKSSKAKDNSVLISNALPIQVKGKIAWANQSQGDWSMGVHVENAITARRIFEALVNVDHRLKQVTPSAAILRAAG